MSVGKPFAAELDSLSGTFEWALQQPLDGIVRQIRALSDLPLIAVGSGGSFTVAHLACALHAEHTNKLAQAMTPLQVIASPVNLRDLAVFLPTAGGKNPDVLGAFRHLVSEEPRSLMAWCATPDSPLSALASRYRFVDFHDFYMPSGKDGFLAVNSLLAFSVLLARSYASVAGLYGEFPLTFKDLIGDRSWNDSTAVDRRCEGLWGRQTLIVLHGPSTLPAAIDIESKFTEAALGSVQVADYRHFAHGRHHWIAKRGRDSGILAILSDDDRRVAESILGLLPSDIPIVRLDVPHSGWLAGIAAMVRGFYLSASVGRARGIDPGDPGVPGFGREIYHMNVYSQASEAIDLPSDERQAIERKARARASEMEKAGRLGDWREAYRLARSSISEAVYCGLTLDYDGTLCHESERFGPLPPVMAEEFVRLLKEGAWIGIATGRGKSVRRSLQESLPKELWKRVVIGYYNGAEIGILDDDSCPDHAETVGPGLLQVADLLAADPFIKKLARITLRSRQITLAPTEGVSPGPIWEYVHSTLLGMRGNVAIALRSGHSVDIVTPESSKLFVVDKVRQLADAGDAAVLRIGDRGRWPGNDHALLNSPHALSADETSPDPKAAWNLAPGGHRGSQATLGYLRSLKATHRGLRLRLKSKKRAGQ